MKILIILAHPDPSSFNAALAEAVQEALDAAGHSVVFHDLYREGFDPVLPSGEIQREAARDEVIDRHCRELTAADGIVVVHPNWWGQPPAILKGWVDRVLRPGIAYRFLEGDNGEGVPVGLLRAQAALVLNTSNTQPDRECKVFGDPLETIWKNCIFALCGVTRVERRTFGVVVTSSAETRRRWLSEAQEMALTLFPSGQPEPISKPAQNQ